MNLISVLIGFMILLPSSGKDDGVKYLQNAIEKFSRIKDYTVDVRVHPELENVKAEDMKATVYYKAPDKVKIDSKGIFILPKEIGVFNPSMFKPEEFNVSVLETLTYEGNPAVKLALSSKKESYGRRDVILIIDKSEWLIRDISIEPAAGSLMDARIKYGEFGGLDLPTEINVNLNLPKADSSQQAPDPHRRSRGGMAGSITIYYSNYRVNSGLGDSLFENEVKQ